MVNFSREVICHFWSRQTGLLGHFCGFVTLSVYGTVVSKPVTNSNNIGMKLSFVPTMRKRCQHPSNTQRTFHVIRIMHACTPTRVRMRRCYGSKEQNSWRA